MSSGVLTRRALLGGGLCACCNMAARSGFAATSMESIGDFGEGGLPTALELGTGPMRRLAPQVWIAEIAAGVWLHSTTHSRGGTMYPANGLVLARPDGAVMIDTGWTPEHAGAVLQWASATLDAPVRVAVATHFHSDRTGGIDALKAKGVRTLAHPLTVALASQHGDPVPEPIGELRDTPYELMPGVELWLPGPGHTRDNVVVWLKQQRVLFGGCFLKSVTSPDLGNVADAVVAEWAGSVMRTRQRYPGARIVVPGHGTINGDPISATLMLLRRDASRAGAAK